MWLHGRVLTLHGDAPPRDGWRHVFDVTLEGQRRFAVETAPLTRDLTPDRSPALGAEVELLGEVRTVEARRCRVAVRFRSRTC